MKTTDWPLIERNLSFFGVAVFLTFVFAVGQATSFGDFIKDFLIAVNVGWTLIFMPINVLVIWTSVEECPAPIIEEEEMQEESPPEEEP